MTTNQTIDRWTWFRSLFWNPPAESPKKAEVGFHINICGSRLESKGSYFVFVDDPSAICGEPTCALCKGVGPMTQERAAQINQRFLQERGYE